MTYTKKIKDPLFGDSIEIEIKCCICNVPTRSHKRGKKTICHSCFEEHKINEMNDDEFKEFLGVINNEQE